MSLKDNFNQAVKELLKKDNFIGDDLSGGAKKSDMDRLIGKPDEMSSFAGRAESLLSPGKETPRSRDIPAAESVSEASPERISEPTAADFRRAVQNQNLDPLADDNTRSESNMGAADYDYVGQEPPKPAPRQAPSREYSEYYGGIGSGQSTAYSAYSGQSSYDTRTPAGSPLRGGRPPESPYYETEETTIISRNTQIKGDINSFANVNIDGSVQGDVKLTKNIAVSGRVVGNIECVNATFSGSSMQGSVSSKGQVQMDKDSMLLGDIATQYLDLNGRIKGNVDVSGKAEFKTEAIIMGNVTASTISVIDGAIIKGYVNTTFMQDSSENVFPESITVGE